MPRKNSISIDDPYLAESQNRSFLGYAGLILLLAGAILFVATFVMDSGGPKLRGSGAGFGVESQSAEAATTVSSGW